MRKRIGYFVFCCSLLLCSPSWGAKVEPTFKGGGYYAHGLVNGDMANYFEDGMGARLDLFGGAKIPGVKFLSAVGLGLDITYMGFAPKDGRDAHYHMLQWDWFKLPIPRVTLGPIGFVAEAGLFWNLIDVKIGDYAQTSVRPGLSAGAGLQIQVHKAVSIDAMARYNWMAQDNERIEGTSQAITMNYAAFFGGLKVSI